MIDIGTLVKWRNGDIGIVTETHKTDGCSGFAYKIKWLEDGAFGWLSAWQFEVIA